MPRMFGSVINRCLESVINTPKPDVGLPVTRLCWSDRRVETITEVSKTGKSFKTDAGHRFILRNGKWLAHGQVGLVGVNDPYIDPSF